MPNTVKLDSGEVVYDLSGEWNATIVCPYSGTFKQLVKITQKHNDFVGIKLEGDERLQSGEDELKGKVKGVNYRQNVAKFKSGLA